MAKKRGTPVGAEMSLSSAIVSCIYRRTRYGKDTVPFFTDPLRFKNPGFATPSSSFALEAYGSMGEDAKNFLRSAAKIKSGDNKVANAQLVNVCRSRIAVAVQRGHLIAINRWLYRRRTAVQGPVGDGSG